MARGTGVKYLYLLRPLSTTAPGLIIRCENLFRLRPRLSYDTLFSKWSLLAYCHTHRLCSLSSWSSSFSSSKQVRGSAVLSVAQTVSRDFTRDVAQKRHFFTQRLLLRFFSRFPRSRCFWPKFSIVSYIDTLSFCFLWNSNLTILLCAQSLNVSAGLCKHSVYENASFSAYSP